MSLVPVFHPLWSLRSKPGGQALPARASHNQQALPACGAWTRRHNQLQSFRGKRSGAKTRGGTDAALPQSSKSAILNQVMSRVFNFSAGPSCLPEEVLHEAQNELLEYGASGQSVMEMSHRTADFEAILHSAEQRVRSLLGVDERYSVLFLQGGASSQFACVPLNLTKKGKAAYADTGIWSDKAIEQARAYTHVDVIASSKDKKYRYIPTVPAFEAALYDYFHFTLNNTIMGTAWHTLPECGATLVTDASSCIMSEPLDVSRFGLIYAGAQKNLAPAGVTLVIIRNDLLENEPLPQTPIMFKYTTHSKNDSMYNTPPCWSIYIMEKVLRWLEKHGGLEAMQKRNREKAAALYDYLDASNFYGGTAEKTSRSMMNITFVITEPSIAHDAEKLAAANKAFLAEAKRAGLVNLAGHRLVGGMRASIYNAMEKAGVDALLGFMEDFATQHGRKSA
ncbi:MAG: 3-phosphoserine/phosphohydroxythreonine transaminase [Treponemataceae bacterium]|nr:MAG: 3-phosphoserine/phosphohydroxythreonine transaminase [Treponemataceae bacterium]